jgi:Tfp pilus assembly protein PilN
MNAKFGASFYRINLIRDLREREKKKERQKRLTIIMGFGCFGFFLISILYSSLTISQMEQVLTHESDQVAHLTQEYQKYAKARLIVDKADLEQLNSLKDKGLFWTKKLSALAKHLPDNYTITSFSFGNDLLRVTGYGFASPQQDHLLILDEYLNQLRADTTFSGTFTKIQLNNTDRKEDGGKVSFDFSAFTKNWRGQ